jgi:hypothetical protein
MEYAHRIPPGVRLGGTLAEVVAGDNAAQVWKVGVVIPVMIVIFFENYSGMDPLMDG